MGRWHVDVFDPLARDPGVCGVYLRSNQISAVGSQSDDASPAAAVAVWLGARFTGLANVASLAIDLDAYGAFRDLFSFTDRVRIGRHRR